MANSTASAGQIGAKNRTNADIENWDVESEEFWQREGKRIASRNLWISIPSLLMGFAVWLMWGMITTQMKTWGFRSALNSCLPCLRLRVSLALLCGSRPRS